MKKLAITLLSTAALMISAHAAMSEDAAAAKDYVILKINGDEIKRSEVDAMWKGIFPGGDAPSFDAFDDNIRQNVLRGLVSERLMLKQATDEGVADKPEVKQRLETARSQIIVQSFLAEKTKDAVTDEKLKKLFDEKAGKQGNQEELHARHILLKTEEEAKAILEKLKKGVDFETLAKEKSEDKASGVQGGDLGYFTADRMVPEFSKAAFALKKGELSKPVKSDFGWHVIKVEDRRKLPKPEFEAMKDQLKEELNGKAVQEYLNGVMSKAEIEYLGADGKPIAFEKSFKPKQ